MIYRPFWILRALIYKPFFKKIKFPSYIGKPIFLLGSNKISLGTRTRIYPMSRMEVHGKNSEIIIENNVGIGQNFHIISGGKLEIGSGTTIAPNVFISNMDNDYREIGKPILEQREIVNETKIGKNCFIGYGAVIQSGTVLGEQCIVGAGSIVKGKFPPFSVIVGNPAKIIKRYDEIKKSWLRINDFE
jgi:acetyltransferase-like isoleucine patch superfamily enzyme